MFANRRVTGTTWLLWLAETTIDTPLQDSDIVMYVDGSANQKLDGTNKVGYAAVIQTKEGKAEPFSSHISAQAAELIAFTEYCTLEGKK